MGSMMSKGGNRFRDKARRKVKEIVIHKAKNRGRIVTHHFETDPDNPMLTPEPEHHSFGASPEEKKRLAAHLAEHTGIPNREEEGETPEEEGKEDAEGEYADTPED